MHNIWIVARKEYRQFFGSPLGYAIAAAIFLVIGILFYLNINQVYQYVYMDPTYTPEVDIVVSPLVSLLFFFTPLITMRSVAEEQHNGTIELLLTAPLRDAELIIGKWLAAFLFLLTIIVISLIFPLVLNQLVQPGIDQGKVLTGYIGLVLMAAMSASIGVAISSFFSNQLAAAAATLGVMLVLDLLSNVSVPGLSYLSWSSHFYNTFLVGVISVQDLLYFISITALGLFVGSISVQSRRWR
jgi:ABC-2 type transport system permease protein